MVFIVFYSARFHRSGALISTLQVYSSSVPMGVPIRISLCVECISAGVTTDVYCIQCLYIYLYNIRIFLPLHLVQTICTYINVFCLVKNQKKCTSRVQEGIVTHDKICLILSCRTTSSLKLSSHRPHKGIFVM